MTDASIQLIIDLHKNNLRQGPGSDVDTLKALQYMHLDKEYTYRIADIGCGTGAQTLALATAIKSSITAVDLFPEFLDILGQRATSLGLTNITTLQASMENLLFQEEEFDIIWSEGAIYNMGFEKGIHYWKQFLKPNGYIAISEITWLTQERPSEIEAHWNNEYPEIGTAAEKIKLLEKYGFSLVGYHILPQSSWIDSYYNPLENTFDDFLKQHHYDDAKNIIHTEKHEIQLYKQYKEYLSYGFYVAVKKTNSHAPNSTIA